MRQIKKQFLSRKYLEIGLFIIIAVLLNQTVVFGDIDGLTLTVTTDAGGGPGTLYNGGVNVTLTANWTRGDTPPFAATFIKGGRDFKSTTVAAPPAVVTTTGNELGQGDHEFSVRVIETSVPNAQPKTAGGGVVRVDLTPPRLTLSLTNTVLSTKTGYNTTTLMVQSDESLSGPPTVTVTPSTGINVSAAVPSVPASFYQFTITVQPTAAGGVYSIQVSGTDQTLPAATANRGTANTSFEVRTTGPTPPVINLSNPTSPTRRTTFTLSGTNTSDCVAINVYEGTSRYPAVITGTTWSATVTASEGRHIYTARGTDNLGNESADSAPFTVIVDTTPPNTPQLIQPFSPTSAEKIDIQGQNASDPISNGVNSPPVTVRLFKLDGVEVQSTTTTDGNFVFREVALAPGENIFYARAEDQANGSRGNPSGNSNMIRIVRDTSGEGVNFVYISRVTPGVLATQPIPLPAGTWLSAGNYDVTVTFNEQMATNTNPTIAYTPAGGGEVANNTGNWASPTVFVGRISIPAGQGSTYDGSATLRIYGARDVAGNLMTPYQQANAIYIDTTAPVTTMASQTETLYIASGTSSVVLRGTSTDAMSGVGYVEIVWQDFNNPTAPYSSETVPIFNGTVASWTYTWNVSSLAPGKYKLWARAADQAVPIRNMEALDPGKYRTVIVDRTPLTIVKISFDDELPDINASGVPCVASDVTKLTATISDGGGGGIDFSKVSTQTFVLTNPNGQVVNGNYTNNGVDIIVFTFPVLTIPGTYTVSLTVWDLAGNSTGPATRTFIIDRLGPDAVTTEPPNGVYANKTNPALAQDQVWIYIEDVPPINYQTNSSTVEVTYNGIVAGSLAPGASTTCLIYNLWPALPNRIATDQSVDGKYDITVQPKDNYGNVGTTYKGYFYLDTQPPAHVRNEPASSSWFGLAGKNIKSTFSDAPRDQTTYHGAQISPDASWYNGLGSGLNLTNASYTARLEVENTPSLTLTGTPVSTDSLGLNFTGVTIDIGTAPSYSGVATLTVSAAVPDRVNSKFPNIRNASYPLYFDYVRPEFTFIKPKPNRKYCKPQLQMEGQIRDYGSATTMLRVIRAEVSGDGRVWAPVNASPSLPAYQASWTVTADISTIPEGQRTFYGRAFDRGENLSHPTDRTAANGQNSEVTIIIDRTAPPPPLLVLPLNDSILNSRGVLFRWSKVNDATRYLIQISDNQGFTNILNNTATTSTDLIGTVANTNQASFAVPRDGTYYWRVACIEDCEDGYNISSFSVTWRFTIDTVKPRVLEVQPTPSTGNKITTGMVTFTIRFSEKMDVTKVPTVSLTSAGGQYMLIEQISYRDNTWTGTTVIPKNASALYDGNATISISDARDLAGNVMETDSTHQVIINTGPAFDIKIFSNPAHEYELVIIARSTEALQAPPTCSVTQGGARVPVQMNFLKEKYYTGSYRIDPSNIGKAYIDVSGTDLFGMVGKGSVEFTVAGVNPSVRNILKTPDGFATLDLAKGAVAKPQSLYIVPRDLTEQPKGSGHLADIQNAINGVLSNKIIADNPELQPIKMLEEIGPVSVKLLKKAWYKSSIKDLPKDIPSEKIHVYRQIGGQWMFVGGAINNGQIQVQLDGLGKLALMADLKPPTLLRISHTDQEKLDDPCPTFEGSVADKGSGIWPESFTLTIDGQPQSGVVLDNDGNFSFKVIKPLAKGPHRVEITVSDRAGNTLRNAFTVVAPGPFAIDELAAYPNPTRGEAVWITYNLQQRADEIKLKILDASGAKVAEFDDFNFVARAAGKIKWDLTNDDGAKVANGVYFFKMEATKNGQKHKAVRKLAVLR